MSKCEQCFYYIHCAEYPFDESGCDDFKDKSRIVELPCEIGTDVWWIDEETQTVQCHKNGVYGILIKSDGVFVMDEGGCLDEIGTKWCYLTKEDAEKALAERSNADADD